MSIDPVSPRRKAPFTVQYGLVVGLAAVVVAQAGLFIRMERAPPPIVTVGVRQITQEYVGKLAATPMSAEEARIRTELYLAVAQDTIQRLSLDKDVLVVARECVLAGEHADLTPQVSRLVSAAFEKAVGERPATPGAAQPTGLASPGASGHAPRP